jgi:hypothetical protein
MEITFVEGAMAEDLFSVHVDENVTSKLVKGEVWIWRELGRR